MDQGDSYGGEGRIGEFRSKHFFGGTVDKNRYYQINLVGEIGANDTAILDFYNDDSPTPRYSWSFTSNSLTSITGTLGTVGLGDGTLGTDGPSESKIGFSHRFSMYTDGTEMSFGFRYSDYTYLKVSNIQVIYKKLKTHNFSQYA